MTETVLSTDSLTKRYGKRVAFEALSLEVNRGDIFGFLGHNGAGKSTTIRMVLGLIRPTSGSAKLLGHDIKTERAKALSRVGAIVEAPAFYDNLSGLQNLKILSSMSGGCSKDRIAEVLDIVGLSGREDDPVGVYSHGMRQRLGIGQALLPNPELIILDEPTDGLDPQGIREVRELILRLRDDLGLTVFLSSLLLYEIEQICNRVVILRDGVMLYQGDVATLIDEEKTVKLTVDRIEEAIELLLQSDSLSLERNGDNSVYLKISDDQIPKINQMLVSRGFQVSELSPQRESLEEVFIRLTEGG
jgi:ABC-2 type transport system ATP-binding protein